MRCASREGTACGVALSLEFLEPLERRAASAAAELTRALRAHRQSRSARTHGALVLAVATAQRVVRLLTAVRERQRPTDLEPKAMEPKAMEPKAMEPKAMEPRAIEPKAMEPKAIALVLARLEGHRAAIRRVLPEAIDAADAAATNSDTAGALRSLMQTRAMLCGELRKVQSAVDELAGSSESLLQLQGSLTDVNATVDMAQRLVRQMIAVKSKDDAVLRGSIVLFVLVVLYIVAQRIFGFFPVKV